MPPLVPPSESFVIGQQLHFHALKATSSLLKSESSDITAAVLPLTCDLVTAAIVDTTEAVEQLGGDESKNKPLMLESKHPYDNSDHQFIPVKVPGAKKLIITFDSKTKSERSCDYLTFYKDDSHTTFWGEERFSLCAAAPGADPRQGSRPCLATAGTRAARTEPKATGRRSTDDPRWRYSPTAS
jgi:hypothetical protein